MSVIAWDGTTLAADKRALAGGLIRVTTKVFLAESGKALCAYVGDAGAGEELLGWFNAGGEPADFPPARRDHRDVSATLLVVWPDGRLWTYECTPWPVQFVPQRFAMGSGRDFALAAMHLGKTAAEAVEVACVFDSGCGNGVDTLSF